VVKPAAAKVDELRCRVFEVPTDQPEADGTLEWSSTTVAVVEARSGETSGTGWTYASSACRSIVATQLAKVVLGRPVVDVPASHEAMVRACRNLGRSGVVSCAVSAVDVALWDLKARLLDVGLADLFGRAREDVPLYGSGGFTTYDDQTTSQQLRGWVTGLGMRRVKIKIGESWGQRPERDMHRVELSRHVVGPDVELYTDANGGYTAKQAIRLGHDLAATGVSWFEEPVSSDDLAGLREVRKALPLDVAAGEYGYEETYFDKMLRAEAVDCLQADATRCGGYTSWIRIAALAHAHGLDISAHCAPHLHAPVAISVPNLRHVEYFHDHARLDPLLFDGVQKPQQGEFRLDRETLGHGMALRDDADRFEAPG
jgi:L-alanine-DL-glutamate epimerase-like enolase superfamily enzyme